MKLADLVPVLLKKLNSKWQRQFIKAEFLIKWSNLQQNPTCFVCFHLLYYIKNHSKKIFFHFPATPTQFTSVMTRLGNPIPGANTHCPFTQFNVAITTVPIGLIGPPWFTLNWKNPISNFPSLYSHNLHEHLSTRLCRACDRQNVAIVCVTLNARGCRCGHPLCQCDCVQCAWLTRTGCSCCGSCGC